ncbi:TonB-dependent receptor [Panacagrimonas sp.]|uniref:TonB-dependent receptor n=1 Tax=Panacagrimonas sp. TaxID=2480088 RepID=UPI003B517F77
MSIRDSDPGCGLRAPRAGHVRVVLLCAALAPGGATGQDMALDIIELPPRVLETSTAPPVIEPAPTQTIVVTARKRPERLQEVPISMTVLSASDIAERQIDDIDDIAAQVPGLEFGEFSGSGQVSIRGVGFNLISGIGENSVAIHTDGVYLPRPSASNLMHDDLVRIEVLRGPQGTLYGRNATGGVLNLISRPPPATTELSAGILHGNYDRRRVKLSAGSGIADGRLRLRASATWDDQLDDVFINLEFPGRDLGARERRGLRLNADLALSDALHMKLRSFRIDETSNGYHIEAYRPPAGSLLAPPGSFTADPYTHRNNDRGLTRKTLTGGSLNLTYDLSEQWSLTALSGYTRFVFDSDGADADGTSLDLFRTERLNRDRTLSQELMLAFTGRRLQWSAGVFYLDEAFDPITDALLDPVGLTGLVPGPLSDRLGAGVAELVESALALEPLAGRLELRLNNAALEDTRSLAVYSDMTYLVVEGLRLYAGLRFVDERKDQVLTVRQVVDGTDLGITNCRQQRSQLHARPVTGRFGVQFLLHPEVMTYAHYARGFKAGGFAIASCDDRYAPEELDAIELGFKITWFDQRLRANGALFHYRYTNLQVEEVSLPFVFVNNAQARVNGAELELLLMPTPAWTLSTHLGWLDAVYTDFANSDNAESLLGATLLARPMDLAGNRLNRSPEWTLGAAIERRLLLASGARLSLRLDAVHKREYFLREFNTPTDRQAPHMIVNAFINYRFANGGVTIRGFINNATDEAVLGGLLGVAGFKAASFGTPRTWGVGVDYAFGS